jgi:hypothetical protein
MDKDNAIKIAKAHLDKMNSENPYSNAIIWTLKEPISLNKDFYFDYSFDLINPENPFTLGGTPGFIVSTYDEKIIDISWEEYHKLEIYK